MSLSPLELLLWIQLVHQGMLQPTSTICHASQTNRTSYADLLGYSTQTLSYGVFSACINPVTVTVRRHVPIIASTAAVDVHFERYSARNKHTQTLMLQT
jgi:hypothetical protein